MNAEELKYCDMLNASTLKNCISMSHYLKRQEELIPEAPGSYLEESGWGSRNRHLHREETSILCMKISCQVEGKISKEEKQVRPDIQSEWHYP